MKNGWEKSIIQTFDNAKSFINIYILNDNIKKQKLY